jgi:hypothetical protein
MNPATQAQHELHDMLFTLLQDSSRKVNFYANTDNDEALAYYTERVRILSAAVDQTLPADEYDGPMCMACGTPDPTGSCRCYV